jgi:DNA-binding NarL/FixJ family response regulator
MIRLLLVENQPAIRFGLRMWLKLAPDVMVVGEAGDGLAALSQASVLRPDVILLEIESIGMDGIELIKAMRKAAPDSAVVVLSLRDDAATRRRAEVAGAAAFVSKHEYGDRLLPVISRVVH